MAYKGSNKLITSEYLYNTLLTLKEKLSGIFADKKKEHVHNNFGDLEGITAEDIASWNDAFSGDYDDLKGAPDIPAPDGITITENEDGTWTAKGLAPTIGDNGNWYLGDKDTGVKVQDSTGRVRLTATGSLAYLGAMLDSTFNVDGNIISVKTLKDLNTSVKELNYIKGLDKNIMDYIKATTSAMEFCGTIPTEEDLYLVESPINGDTYIVEDSVSNNNKSASFTYVANTNTWVCVGVVEIEIRDFNKEPLDLTKEVTGVLPKDNIEGYHKHENKDALDKLSEVDGKLYFDDMPIGSGTTSDIATGGTSDYMELKNKPQINGVILTGDKTTTELGLDITLMSKNVYLSETDSDAVKKADVANTLTLYDQDNQPYSYYGTNERNEVGKHVFPINTAKEESIIQQRIFENVTEGDVFTINSMADINNRAIINIWQEVKGNTNVDGNIRIFNKNTKDSVNCSKKIYFDDDSAQIAKSIEVDTILNEDNGFYDIDLSMFVSINKLSGGV